MAAGIATLESTQRFGPQKRLIGKSESQTPPISGFWLGLWVRRRCPSTVPCTAPSGESPNFRSVDSRLRAQLTKQPPQSSSKGNFFVRVRFGRVPSTVEEVLRVRFCCFSWLKDQHGKHGLNSTHSDTVRLWASENSWWTFRIFFFCLGEGKGESEAPGRGGGRFFFFENPRGGGVCQEREGGEGPGGCLPKYFFFSGPKFPPRIALKTRTLRGWRFTPLIKGVDCPKPLVL